uniref:rhodanese-like domain-containing protein n=1 Tax=Methylobacterium sp. NMS12 TaxID=3079766 RepID=UPI003F882656
MADPARMGRCPGLRPRSRHRGPGDRPREPGGGRRRAGGAIPHAGRAPGGLAEGEAILLDLSDSRTYAAGHISGARFAIRSRLAEGLSRLPAEGTLVLTGSEPILPRLAAADLRTLTARPVKVLAGGNAAWRGAGYPVEEGARDLHDPAEDIWQSPYYQEDRFAAFQRYLDWEIALAAQIERDETVSFRRFPEAA